MDNSAILIYKYIQASHSRVSVGREIEVAIRTEGREHLITGGIDWFTQIFYSHSHTIHDACAPDVQAPYSAWHIGNEIEPLAIGRDCRMSKSRKGVTRQMELFCLSPRSIGTIGNHYLCITRSSIFKGALREIHLLAVRRNAAGTFVIGSIQT